MKRLIFALALAAGALPLAPAAHAGDCNNAGNQMQMGACAAQANQAANAELNTLYGQLKGMLNPGEVTLLKDAEVKWMAWRDAECAYETAETAGGSINSMMVTECLTDLTNDRIKAIKKQIACPAGSLACPAN